MYATNNSSPDDTLRVKEYGRVRKRLEKQYFDKGIIDSRPFTPPILKHYEECGHRNQDDGFDPDVLNKMKDTTEWGLNLSQQQLRIAGAAKVDTPEHSLVQGAISSRVAAKEEAKEKFEEKKETPSISLPLANNTDVVMIDD